MTEQARQSQLDDDENTRSGGKKRKGSKKVNRAAKKQKKNDASAAALKSAQDKHKAIVGSGEKPIFIQPPLLASGCVLKDYQLEGVRWLTSLFENGVSGILADEMVRFIGWRRLSFSDLIFCFLLTSC